MGLVFDIQGYCIHDGPGCRTSIFFSGCPLHCGWCCNPEGILPVQRLMRRKSRCRRCGECRTACKKGAISAQLEFNRTFCDSCDSFDCVQACTADTLSVSGRYYSSEEILAILERDRDFWGSGGGVTFTGGEPLFQGEFLLDLLNQCRDRQIHTALETSGFAQPEIFAEVAATADWIFTDLKHMNAEKHREGTNQGNQLILKNIKAAMGKNSSKFLLRLPLIPGYNDDHKNILETVEFVRYAGLTELNVLPFHRLGESKYEQLGNEYEYSQAEVPEEGRLVELKQLIESHGIKCYLGPETPF
ncbi:MAG: glycyl-radical enzyme activating protein [Candidatus Wallbacteria bacterium]|nr:glycyl-radical enzyme activating protein [Candidatus Wallbacteria bacterium]